MAGTLYVVATPLGNLDDLSPRAAATLCRVTVVAAEDTRHTKILLAHVGSRAELVSFHAHSSETARRRILDLLGTGKDVALVTDAGTPAVSDPGADLVAAARGRDVPVVTVPGPTAVAAARAAPRRGHGHRRGDGAAGARRATPRSRGAGPRPARPRTDAQGRGPPGRGGDGDHQKHGVQVGQRAVKRGGQAVRRSGGLWVAAL